MALAVAGALVAVSAWHDAGSLAALVGDGGAPASAPGPHHLGGHLSLGSVGAALGAGGADPAAGTPGPSADQHDPATGVPGAGAPPGGPGSPGSSTVDAIADAGARQAASEVDADANQLPPAGAATEMSPVFAGAIAAVPRVPPGWTISSHTISSAGLTRAYLVARPATRQSSPASPVPVVVVLHGKAMTPGAIERLSGFLALVGRAVVVYPAGYAQSWNAGYCCAGAHAARTNDVGFIEAVIRHVVAGNPGTSAHRVYLVGYSNGGRMVYRLACADPLGFAGIAAVEAVATSTCQVADHVPLIEVASTADPLLTISSTEPAKYVAGRPEVSVSALISQWRQIESCGGSPTTVSYPGMTTTEWASCASAGRVALAVYSGGSHAWPQGDGATPSAQELIWAFFHTSPVARP